MNLKIERALLGMYSKMREKAHLGFSGKEFVGILINYLYSEYSIHKGIHSDAIDIRYSNIFNNPIKGHGYKGLMYLRVSDSGQLSYTRAYWYYDTTGNINNSSLIAAKKEIAETLNSLSEQDYYTLALKSSFMNPIKDYSWNQYSQILDMPDLFKDYYNSPGRIKIEKTLGAVDNTYHSY